MRFVLLAVAAGLLGCKDKPAQKAIPAESKPATRVTPPRLDVQGDVPATGLGPKIVITTKELMLDGEPIGTLAIEQPIARKDLDALTHRLELAVKGDERVALTIDGAVPFYQFAVVFDALHKAGFDKLALLTGAGARMIPLDLIESP